MKKMIAEVKKRLSAKRFFHSKAVAETAEKLAKYWAVNPEKAYLAGLLHDIGKELSLEEMIQIIPQGAILNSEEKSVDLLHSLASTIIAQRDFKISDEEILQAIKCHTVGGKEIGPLAQILYLADYIAPGRKQPGVEEVRKIANIDLEQALLMVYNQTLTYLNETGKWIHPSTVLGKNEMEKKMAERRRS